MSLTAEDRLRRRFTRLLKDCVEEARRLGCQDPYLYFETEAGLVVLDGPPHDDNENPRHDAVVLRLAWPRKVDLGIGGSPDVGAW